MMKFVHSFLIFIFIIFCFSETYASKRQDISYDYEYKGSYQTNSLSASISANKTAVCTGDAAPKVIFKVTSGGASPYTFYYRNNGSSGSIVSAAGVDSAVININTSIPGTYNITLDSISYNNLPAEVQSNLQVSILVGDFPNADFSFTDNVCSGTNITFIPTLYNDTKYSYSWNFGDGTSVSTETSPTHNFFPVGTSGYQTYDITLTITDKITGCVSSKTKIISIYKGADTSITSDAGYSDYFDGYYTFSACISEAYKEITFYNGSTTKATDLTYTIDWGDGSPVFTAATWTSTTHSYSKGIWELTYTITTSSGCNVTRVYKVFLGSTPGVTLGFPGNTDICAGEKVTFPITGTENNPPGTTYEFVVNDGSAPVHFTHPPPASVEHVFATTSCGTNSNDGTTTYQNAFSARIVATNPCTSSSGQVMPIYVTSPPPAIINSTSTFACVNEAVTFQQLTTLLSIANSNGKCTTPNIVWSITPDVNYNLLSGKLGNDYGTDTYTAWNNGTESITVAFTQAGTYVVKLRVGSKCSLDEVLDTVCVSAPTEPTFTLDTNNGCFPLTVNTDNTTIESENCGTPLNYSWTISSYSQGTCGTTKSYTMTDGTNVIANGSSNSKNTTIVFKNPGIYTLRLSASNNCGANSKTETITVKAPPKVLINAISDVCQTSTETIIHPTAQITNCGSDALTYAWTFTGGTPSASSDADPGNISYSSTGKYYVELKVTNECGVTTAATDSFVIKPTPTLTSTLSNQLKCAGIMSDAVNFTADIANTTFYWTNNNTQIGLPASGNGDIAPFTLQNTGSTTLTATITVTPSLNGCDGTSQSFTITVEPSVYFTSQPKSSDVCINGVPETLSVTYTNGTGTPQYQWYSNTTNDNTTGTAISGETSSTYVPPTSTVGTTYYYCTLSLPSSTCGAITSDIAHVTVTDYPSIDQQPLESQQVCVGAVIDSLRVSVINGAGTPTYQWYSNTVNSNSGGAAISGANSLTYEPPVFNSVGTYYYYVIIDYSANSACGTVISNTAEVIVVSDPVIDVQPITTQSVCQNTTPTVLSVTVSGGIGTYNYQWYSNTTNSNTGGQPIASANGDTYSPPTDVTGIIYYYCEVTQTGLGCNVTSETSEVNVAPAPIITTQPQSATICFGDNLSALSVSYQDGVGTPQYQWYENTVDNNTSGTAITGETNQTYNPPVSTPGTNYYYCVITLPSGGCNTLISNTAQITINQYPSISNYVTQIPSGATFAVTPSTVVYPTDIIPSGTTYTWSAPVIQPAGAITGASAETNPQTSISQTLINITNSTATVTYIVTPEANGCLGDTFKVVVTVYPTLVVDSTVVNVTCFGANDGEIHLQISGGYPPYSVSWTGPNGFASTSADISGLSPGDYSLYVVDDQGVSYSGTITISEPSELAIVTVSKKDIDCNGGNTGQISTTGAGGTRPYSYSWTKDGNPFSTDSIINDLQAGVYELTLTDANHCGPVIQSYTLTESAPIIISVINTDDILCYGDSTGSISVEVSGGVPKEISSGIFGYDYLWTGPNGYTSSNKDIDNIKAGAYTLAVTDSLNCTQTMVVNVNQSSEIVISVTKKSVSCYPADDGAIKIEISGGLPPYQIEWNDFSKETFRENLSPGTYVVTVTDGNSCVVSKEIIIDSNSFQLNPIIKQITCNGAQNGSITLNVTNNINPITLVWSDNPLAGANRNGLSPGIYTVTVSDSYCTYTNSFTIYEPLAINAAATITNAFSCGDPNSGAISLVVSGGTAPYTYQWSNGETTKDITNIPAGTYIIDITDSNGCTYSKQFTVIRQEPINLLVDVTSDYNCESGVLNMKCIAQVAGGVGPYQFSWSSGTQSGTNGEIMETAKSGIYILTVTDNIGCTATYTLELTVPEVGVEYSLIDCNNKIYSFSALIPYGQPTDYTYLWSFGDGETSTEQYVQHKYSESGTYKTTLNIRNKDGCETTFEKDVEVIAPPALLLDKIPTICPGDSILLHVSGAYSYKWFDGTTSDSILLKNPGSYFVGGTNIFGCSSVLNFKLSNYDSYNYAIQSDRDVISSDNSIVNFWSEDIPNSEYYWDFGDGNTAVGYNQYHTYIITGDGYYDVTLKVNNPDGCNEYATKRIWIESGQPKNTFSPNGDGVDDVYMKGWHIKIYNRNGVLMYDGTDGWDGTYKGRKVSNDTYFVVVYYPTQTGTKTVTGYVTIIR